MTRRDADDRDRFMKFFPSDWRGDDELRACSLAARGLWMDLLCLAHKYEGVVLIAGAIPTDLDIAKQVGSTKAEVTKLIEELLRRGVASRREDGALYSRRMVRDARRRAINVANGARGGNPALKADDGESHTAPVSDIASVDAPDKTPPTRPVKRSTASPVNGSVAKSVNQTSNPQNPDTRSQIPETRSGGADPGRSEIPAPSAQAYGAPLMPSPLAHRSHGWCNDRGLCVPQQLFAELLGRMGGPQHDAALRAWMGTVIDRLGDTVPAETVWVFWRQEFSLWRALVDRETAPGGTVINLQKELIRLLDGAGIRASYRQLYFADAQISHDPASGEATLIIADADRRAAVERSFSEALEAAVVAQGGRRLKIRGSAAA